MGYFSMPMARRREAIWSIEMRRRVDSDPSWPTVV